MASIAPELQNIADRISTEFGSLTPAQVNWKPNPESWSVGQCLEHLIITNELFFNTFDRIAAGKRRNSFWEQWSPLSGIGGRFLVRSLRSDEKKYKVPTRRIAPPSDVAPDIVAKFVVHQKRLIEKTESCRDADPEKTILTSPFMPLMTYSLAHTLEIFIEHESRHFRQAKRVTEMQEFPR